MLGKLIRYEFKSTARLFIPLFVATLIFAFINRFSLQFKQAGFLYTIIPVVTMITYVMLMVGMFVLTFVLMIQRFYKNLLGDEGYLMFTLPVQTYQHIISKVLTSILWVISSSFVGWLSVVIISRQRISFSYFPEMITDIENDIGINGYLFLAEMGILVLLGLIAAILMLYCAIALGHTFNKHKLLASFGMFIVINMISQIVMALMVYTSAHIFHFEDMSTPASTEIHRLFCLFLLYALLLVGCNFTLTVKLLKKRLNLE